MITHSAEEWTLVHTDVNKIESTEMCLYRLLKVKWNNRKITNTTKAFLKNKKTN